MLNGYENFPSYISEPPEHILSQSTFIDRPKVPSEPVSSTPVHRDCHDCGKTFSTKRELQYVLRFRAQLPAIYSHRFGEIVLENTGKSTSKILRSLTLVHRVKEGSYILKTSPATEARCMITRKIEIWRQNFSARRKASRDGTLDKQI